MFHGCLQWFTFISLCLFKCIAHDEIIFTIYEKTNEIIIITKLFYRCIFFNFHKLINYIQKLILIQFPPTSIWVQNFLCSWLDIHFYFWFPTTSLEMSTSAPSGSGSGRDERDDEHDPFERRIRRRISHQSSSEDEEELDLDDDDGRDDNQLLQLLIRNIGVQFYQRTNSNEEVWR